MGILNRPQYFVGILNDAPPARCRFLPAFDACALRSISGRVT
jgi:hypothetical protein